MIHEMKKQFCPTCNHMFECSEPLNEENSQAPQEGDVTLCIQCATILVFTEDLSVRHVTPFDISTWPLKLTIELAVEQEFLRKQNAARKAMNN